MPKYRKLSFLLLSILAVAFKSEAQILIHPDSITIQGKENLTKVQDVKVSASHFLQKTDSITKRSVDSLVQKLRDPSLDSMARLNVLDKIRMQIDTTLRRKVSQAIPSLDGGGMQLPSKKGLPRFCRR